VTDKLIAAFRKQKQDTQEELESLYHSLLNTAHDLVKEDNLWDSVVAILSPEMPRGVQFIYPHWDSAETELDAWDTIEQHILDTECLGVVVSRLTRTANVPKDDAIPARPDAPTLIFTLLGPGLARTYLHPIEDDHFLPMEGPYTSNMSNIYPFSDVS